MSFLDIPEDVIWEMSLDRDLDEYDAPYRRTSRTITCKRCGCSGLKWVNQRGWKLAYASGKLEGKLHACGPNS